MWRIGNTDAWKESTDGESLDQSFIDQEFVEQGEFGNERNASQPFCNSV